MIKAIKFLFLAIIAFLLFGCGKKKKAAPNLANWLEQHFPGRFEIVETWTSDPIKNLSFKVKRSIVADKTDSLLQIQLKWDARVPDLELSPDMIEPLVETAKRELADSRALFDVAKSAGFSDKISASIRHNDATVLIFDNPTPENRKQVLIMLKTAFSKWPAAQNFGLFIAFMEPAGYGTKFGDIVPLAHWESPVPWQRQNTVVWLGGREGYDFDARVLQKEWAFSTDSERFEKTSERARSVAEKWASERLKKTVFLLPRAEYLPVNAPLGTQMKFPFAFQKTEDTDAPAKGYVVGDYLLDGDVFENWRIEYE